MSYQCVIRNTSGVLVTNQSVGIRISILQGTTSGTGVYQETYNPNPQTNANGLVTVEIGGGIPVSGIFSNINWASGPYYLKTETDPTGGTTYTVVGTSQLLSVPYSLFSKTTSTADYNTLSNLPTLNIANWNTAYGWGNHAGLYRPIGWLPGWSDITGKPSFATVSTSGNYNDLLNKPITDGSATKVTAGTNITITGIGTTGAPYVVNSKSHSIGDSYGGGIVFYVYDNGQHGLIAATADQGSARWYAGTSTYTMAKANGVGAGKANTASIIASQAYGDGATYAARICNEYLVTFDGVTYGDWYLPSTSELNLLLGQKNVVPGLAGKYWSSNESDNDHAVYLATASPSYADLKSWTYFVRPIRAF
jgi:hypothetical protein